MSTTETLAAPSRIVAFPGDGVGGEVMTAALGVLDAVAEKFGRRFQVEDRQIGGAAIDAYGTPLRREDLEAARAADAVLLGAVGGPKWDDPHASMRPEQGLLRIRKGLGLFANLRPVAVSPALSAASPIKAEIVAGTDMLVVRELTGGIYFGRPSRQWRDRRGRAAVDTLRYREHEIARVTRLAFELAQGRRNKVTSVDKANVLSSSRLWRTMVSEIGCEYPTVELEHVLVDAMAMHLVRQPTRFDVVLTENMFGDILTDEASVLGGSIGLLPSASLGAPHANGRRPGLYEPIHGSAPDIAGLGRANPVGMILSVALALRYSLWLDREAMAVEQAVVDTLAAGMRTADLIGVGGPVSTEVIGDAIVRRILS
ncbi:MAG: 3-isopropylmalate dehydrogenase [Chloroflexia bacterium]|nr:3-isopropylmalate dehydrogenase [Chloroflexia bacterium]